MSANQAGAVPQTLTNEQLHEHAVQLAAMGMCAIDGELWRSRQNIELYIEQKIVPQVRARMASPVPSATREGDEQLLRSALSSAVRLAIMRHDIALEPDTATEEEIADDAAGACFGEECCDDTPISEVTEILRRMAGAASGAGREGEKHV